MVEPLEASIRFLGQAGFRLVLEGVVIYLDPYLSHSVEKFDNPLLVRAVPIPLEPETILDADWILISHDHLDHCDPETLPAIAKSSPHAKFVGPAPVMQKLRDWGIEEHRLRLADEGKTIISHGVSYCAVPAAHPNIQRDSRGNLDAVGYIFELADKRIYFAGDTGVTQELLDGLKRFSPIETAILPFNEQNFFKAQDGILGNMSVREALLLAKEIGARTVVPIHWDMFEQNSVYLDEIRIVHENLTPEIELVVNPQQLGIGDTAISIVIRTLNEAKYLPDLLESVFAQEIGNATVEVIVVDSGSTDGTQEIAERFGCKMLTLRKDQFSFGRSLNIGCEAARGQVLVFISGHCIPVGKHWLKNLVAPIEEGQVSYSYGRQTGGPNTFLSEEAVFSKGFPVNSQVPQDGFFCNNANAALDRMVWEKHKFDETLTGLEDMALAKKVLEDDGRVGYVADAHVIHNHEETWPQVRRRYEREAIALQQIMPQIHINLADLARFIIGGVVSDMNFARSTRRRFKLHEVVSYRWNQYVGSWKGNRDHRILTHIEKEKYFYPS